MSKSRKIGLFVHGIDNVGGAEVAALRWAYQLTKRKVDLTVFTTQAMSRWRKHPAYVEKSRGFPIVRIPVWMRTKKLADDMFIWQSRILLNFFFNIDVQIICGMSDENLVFGQIARKIGSKVIFMPMSSSVIGDINNLKSSSAGREHEIDLVLCLTSILQDEVVQWGYPKEKTDIFPNGVDTHLFSPSETERSNAAIYVGKFRPEKRVDLLVRAWALVERECPYSSLTLLGGGPLQAHLESLVSDLDLKTVKFLPVTSEQGVAAQLKKHSIFVLPSVSEGMSNALLEAMSSGLCPVVTDTISNYAVIDRDRNGIMFDGDQPEDLAHVLIDVLSETERSDHIGKEARLTVLNQFDLDMLMDRMVHIVMTI